MILKEPGNHVVKIIKVVEKKNFGVLDIKPVLQLQKYEFLKLDVPEVIVKKTWIKNWWYDKKDEC